MKLEYHTTSISFSDSFQVERKKISDFQVNWHSQKEYELLYFIKGDGVRIIGDHMGRFKDQELILIGPGLPHFLKAEKKLTKAVDLISIKFDSAIGAGVLFSLPELSEINDFMERSRRGVLFSSATLKKVKEQLLQIPKNKKAAKVISLLAILDLLTKERDFEYLASDFFSVKESLENKSRILKVIHYIEENHSRNISLEELAKISHMTSHSFCRFFRERTGKTAFQFIREYRINKACYLLINTQKSIAEICFSSGFNSLSSFNRVFKDHKKVSASQFKVQYLTLLQ